MQPSAVNDDESQQQTRSVDNSNQPNQRTVSTVFGTQNVKKCVECKEIIHGKFVRALGDHYHLECFKCYVHSKFIHTNLTNI